MMTFLEFIGGERLSSVSPLPKLAKLPGLPDLPKLPKLYAGATNNNANSDPPRPKMAPAMAPMQAVPQLQQVIAQLSMLIRRLSQG
jgi:hypothetical protein